jgi:hypothetical protein
MSDFVVIVKDRFSFADRGEWQQEGVQPQAEVIVR